MVKDLKTRQQSWRDKQRAKGRKCYNVWLEPEAAQILDEQLPETGKQKAITRILSELLVTSKQVTSNVINNESKVTSNVTDNDTHAQDYQRRATRKTDSSKDNASNPSSRSMSLELEDYILALREKGLSLNAVAECLANDGHLSKTGEPYGTSTINKVVKRARKRLDGK